MSGVAPQDDEHGRPIHLELCPACDTGDVDRPAAGLLVQFANNRGGWTEQEQLEVAALRERERDLAAAIVTPAFWGEVTGPERPDARSQLRHALATASDGGEQET